MIILTFIIGFYLLSIYALCKASGTHIEDDEAALRLLDEQNRKKDNL